MFRKQQILLVFAPVLLSIVLISGADASLVGAHIKLYDGPGSGNGGEFKVSVDYSPTNGTFQADAFRTFCVEISEHIAFGATYRVMSLTTATTTGKNLTVQAAALYRAFWDGIGTTGTTSILGQDYRRTFNPSGTATSNYQADARSLQLAIWKTMGWDTTALWTSGGYGSEYNNNAKARNWVAEANRVAAGVGPDSEDFFGVRIMNLTGRTGTGHYQDQLVVIPEPRSLAIWGLAIVGIGVVICLRLRRVPCHCSEQAS